MGDTFGAITLSFSTLLVHFHICTVYIDLPSFISPCLIAGDSLRPDLLLTVNNTLYILELTPSFETIVQVYSIRRANRYITFIKHLSSTYNKVTFIRLSTVALCIMCCSSSSFLSLLQDLNFEKSVPNGIIMKTIMIAIRSSCNIFYQRNKSWNIPELLNIEIHFYYSTFKLYPLLFYFCYLSCVVKTSQWYCTVRCEV